MASGRLFQARGPATAKTRSPSFDLGVAGTIRSDDETERRRRNDFMLATVCTLKLAMHGADFRVGSGIQIHRDWTVYVRPSAASEGRREEVRCGRATRTHRETSGGVNDRQQSVKAAAR